MKDKEKRLGANVMTGTKDVKSHPFFEGINWGYIEKRLVKPPIIPVIKGEVDLTAWEDAVGENISDEEEIAEMAECGEFEDIKT